jgi:prolyl-tRNA editing enzyme YbaK/EbsC (Cys-tRNA(Pro) deacylase)
LDDRLTPLDRAIASGAIDAEIIWPGVPTPTVPAAALALGVSENQILKSLVFTNGVDDVLAIACGLSRVSIDKLQAATSVRELKLAKPLYVLARTGYPVGALPPVAHEPWLTVVVDERVTGLDIAIAGGGRVDALLRITPSEILRVTTARVVDIAD